MRRPPPTRSSPAGAAPVRPLAAGRSLCRRNWHPLALLAGAAIHERPSPPASPAVARPVATTIQRAHSCPLPPHCPEPVICLLPSPSCIHGQIVSNKSLLPPWRSLNPCAQKMFAARLCDNCFSLHRMDNVCGCNLVAYLPSFIAGHTATHFASGLRHPQDPFMRARHVCCCLRRQTVDVFSPSGALSMRQAVAHLRKLALPHPSPSCIQKASDPP